MTYHFYIVADDRHHWLLIWTGDDDRTGKNNHKKEVGSFIWFWKVSTHHIRVYLLEGNRRYFRYVIWILWLVFFIFVDIFVESLLIGSNEGDWKIKWILDIFLRGICRFFHRNNIKKGEWKNLNMLELRLNPCGKFKLINRLDHKMRRFANEFRIYLYLKWVITTSGKRSRTRPITHPSSGKKVNATPKEPSKFHIFINNLKIWRKRSER